MSRLLAIASALTAAGAVALVIAPATAARHGAVLGELALRTEVFVAYPFADCPPGTARLFECFVRSGNAIVPGLGSVEETYAYVLENAPPGCTASPGSDAVRLPPTTVRLTVAGKGAIDLRTGGTGCLNRSGSLRSSEPFTIVGGSGLYAGASGGGTLESLSVGPPSFTGVDTWTGTLVVPGLQFDLTAPTINGAVNRTVLVPRRAKQVRVSYAVKAQDEVDGVVAATCSPRSGSPFHVGRTRVTCAATDTSGNTAAATFTVKVTRRR
jgi:HYR domain